MTYNAQILPQNGQPSDTIALFLDIFNDREVKVKVENATHGKLITEALYEPNTKQVQIPLDLMIPEHSSDAMISIFVSIEEKENEQFKLAKVIPLIYSIDEVASQSSSVLNVVPSFVSKDDSCKVSINGQQDDKYVISINDSRLNIIVGPSGVGTIHFKIQDVLLSGGEGVLHKYPIYYYSSDDNYIGKKFSGTYLNVIPNDILAAADVDPRCETYNPETWEPPAHCEEEPCEPGDPGCPCVPGTPGCPLEPGIPGCPELPGGGELPTTDCDYEDCVTCVCQSVSSAIDEDACRNHKISSALISNGMVLNSYVSVDETYASGTDTFNKQRAFVKSDTTSLTCQIIAAQNVAVTSKNASEDFTVYITEEIYATMKAIKDAGKGIQVLFMDEDMEYKSFEVKDILEADEYSPFYTLIVDAEDSDIILSKLNACVYSIFYELDGGIVPASVVVPANIAKLPFIEVDSIEGKITATNVSISSNNEYRGEDGESFVHIVAEGYHGGNVHLFYYGFSVGPLGYTSINSDSWIRLTFDGSNKNAKTVTDRYNNLHVFWESDRTGLDQIYYGVIGPSSIFYSNVTLSSVIDKQAELIGKSEKPFGHLSQNIIQPTGETLERISEQWIVDEYTGGLTYPNKGILSTAWIKNETNDGEVTVIEVDDVSTITVDSSTLVDTAMAFTRLDKDNFLDLSSGKLSQINYQVSFGFTADITQDVSGLSSLMTDDDITEIYEAFKGQYTETVDTDVVDGMPYYVSGGNRFNIGMKNEIYDRFIPIMGAYKNSDFSDYVEGGTVLTDFTIRASGVDRNLNHYFLAVVPEKIRLKATNIESSLDYEVRVGSTVGYDAEEVQEYYTGRAALAVIYTADSYLLGYELSNVTVRNFSKPFALASVTDIDVLVNYSKMFNEDSARYLGISPGIADSFPRFVCSLSVMVNGSAAFAESFLVDMSDKNRAFDIGLGVASQGSFKADNFAPYNSTVFENAVVSFTYSDVTISSPTYKINTDVCSIPSYAREQSDLSAYDFYGNEEDTAETFFRNYGFLFDGEITDPSTGLSIGYVPEDPVADEYGIIPDEFDIETQTAFTLNEFMQVPLTLEGINSNPSISLDFVNNIHLVWQSNRDKSWNIFYSCSTDRNIPFRFDTQITDTDSNSLSPSVSSDSNGRRMVVWHDDRSDDFQIYSARALETYNLEDKICENIDTLMGFTLNDNPSQSTSQADSSVITFSQSNSDPSGSIRNLHFRITFYSDAARERAVYSSFSVTDDKRWYVSGSTYEPMGSSGVSIALDTSVEIIYVPDIYPQQMFSKQGEVTLTGNDVESYLLSGIKYYATIESYDIDTAQMSTVSEVEFKVDASDAETDFWRENLDKNNWICSSQGQDDLLVANRGEQSLFPSISSNIFGTFFIAYQSLDNGSTLISRAFWDAPNDKIYGSGQGLWETKGPFNGQKPKVITDQGQSFYITSSDDDYIYSSKCALSTADDSTDPSNGTTASTGETICIPGTASTISDDFKMRINDTDKVGSFVINKDDIVSVVDKTDIRIEIAGIYGAYAVRFRNQDEDWSDWIDVNDNIFISDDRFVAPWTLPKINGIRHLCCQVLTIYGTTEVRCIDVFVNMETVDYFVKYYIDEEKTTEVPSHEGFALLATRGEESQEIYVTVTFNGPQDYSTLTFDVIHQGISNIFGSPLTPVETSSPYTNYKGSFTIRQEDGIYDKDGEGFLKVKFEDDSTVDSCVSDSRDLYNQMLIKSELDFLDTVLQTPEEAFRENATRTVSKVLDINDYKQYHDNDDPHFLFGNMSFYRE